MREKFTQIFPPEWIYLDLAAFLFLGDDMYEFIPYYRILPMQCQVNAISYQPCLYISYKAPPPAYCSSSCNHHGIIILLLSLAYAFLPSIFFLPYRCSYLSISYSSYAELVFASSVYKLISSSPSLTYVLFPLICCCSCHIRLWIITKDLLAQPTLLECDRGHRGWWTAAIHQHRSLSLVFLLARKTYPVYLFIQQRFWFNGRDWRAFGRNGFPLTLCLA